MLLSLAILFLVSIILYAVFERIKLQGILGFILAGILLGPSGFNLIDQKLFAVSDDFKVLALMIILIRAGFGLKKKELNKVGKYAFRVGIVPVLLEVIAVALLSHYLFSFKPLIAILLGLIVAPVSPALVIPSMLELKNKVGTKNNIVSTLLIASTTIDNVFCVTMFGLILSVILNCGLDAGLLIKIPVGFTISLIMGFIVSYFFVWLFKRYDIRDTKKALIFLFVCVLIHSLEHYFYFSSFLAIIFLSFLVLERLEPVAHKLALKFGKIWIFAEIVLFVFIGAQFKINMPIETASKAILIVFVAILLRVFGMYIALRGMELDFKQKTYCALSCIPKATVQATLGAVPLMLNIEGGELILAVSVISIIITTPLGVLSSKNFEKFL